MSEGSCRVIQQTAVDNMDNIGSSNQTVDIKDYQNNVIQQCASCYILDLNSHTENMISENDEAY